MKNVFSKASASMVMLALALAFIFTLFARAVVGQALPTPYTLAGYSDPSAINFTAQDSSGHVVLSWSNSPVQPNNVIVGLEWWDTTGQCPNYQYYCVGVDTYGVCVSHYWDSPIWYFQAQDYQNGVYNSVTIPYNMNQYDYRKACFQTDGQLKTYYVILQSVRQWENLACKFLFEYTTPLDAYFPCGVDTTTQVASPVQIINGVVRITKSKRK